MAPSLSQLLDNCRGPLSKKELAQRLGITQRMLSALYSGQRNMGCHVARSLYREFPQYRDQLIALFFSPEKRNNSITIGTMGDNAQ